jgi:hypothetical protein
LAKTLIKENLGMASEILATGMEMDHCNHVGSNSWITTILKKVIMPTTS